MPARMLTYADAAAAHRIVAVDPVRNVFVASRLDAGILNPMVPGTIWGWPGERVEAMLHIGANMVPVAAGPGALGAFAQVAGPNRSCQSIVGPAQMVLSLWRLLTEHWGTPYSLTREVRPQQPVMTIVGGTRVVGDPRVRTITMAEFEPYLTAAVAMYAEEVGDDPRKHGAPGDYRNHCRWLIEHGRAFGIVEHGRVVFKADMGATSGGVAQLQGVWLDPSLRGQGRSAAAVAAVVDRMLREHQTVSLYVNSFNLRAIRCYERIGFRTVDEFATVLY